MCCFELALDPSQHIRADESMQINVQSLGRLMDDAKLQTPALSAVE